MVEKIFIRSRRSVRRTGTSSFEVAIFFVIPRFSNSAAALLLPPICRLLHFNEKERTRRWFLWFKPRPRRASRRVRDTHLARAYANESAVVARSLPDVNGASGLALSATPAVLTPPLSSRSPPPLTALTATPLGLSPAVALALSGSCPPSSSTHPRCLLSVEPLPLPSEHPPTSRSPADAISPAAGVAAGVVSCRQGRVIRSRSVRRPARDSRRPLRGTCPCMCRPPATFKRKEHVSGV